MENLKRREKDHFGDKDERTILKWMWVGINWLRKVSGNEHW